MASGWPPRAGRVPTDPGASRAHRASGSSAVGTRGVAPEHAAHRPLSQQRHDSSEQHRHGPPRQQAPSAAAGATASNIKVVVRVRPPSDSELAAGDHEILEVQPDSRTLTMMAAGPRGTTLARGFEFDACLGPTTSQQAMFVGVGVPQLLDAALTGYACTIFAYGQTGSGKTYTMSGHEEILDRENYQGDENTDGVITRSLVYLFEALHRKPDVQYTLKASYLEVYNEQVYDLLAAPGSPPLPVRHDAQRGFFVPGLAVVPLPSLPHALHMVQVGTHARRVGSHELNKDSSRSHSMLILHVDGAAVAGDPVTTFGKLTFVDLAGSERLKQSKSTGGTMKETGSINRSLMALGKVITALSEAGKAGSDAASAHVPFRDSKLTQLLMDSLGGEALALMIATCSPAARAADETLSTLHYATSAQSIRNRPVVRLDPQQEIVRLLRREVQTLQHENAALREQLTAVGMEPAVGRGAAAGAGGVGPPGVRLSPLPRAPQSKLTRATSLGAVPSRGSPFVSPQGSPTVPRVRARRNSLGSTKLEPLNAEPVNLNALPSIDDLQASQSTREGLVAHMQTASKSELMKRLHIAAALLGQYGEKHVKLLDTQSALREKHHRAEEEADRLEAKLEHLEACFVGCTGDGTASAFGVEDDEVKRLFNTLERPSRPKPPMNPTPTPRQGPSSITARSDGEAEAASGPPPARVRSGGRGVRGISSREAPAPEASNRADSRARGTPRHELPRSASDPSDLRA